MMSADVRKDKIESIKYLIEGNKQQIRCTTTDLTMKDRVLEKIDAAKKVIENAQKEIERLERSLTHGPEYIAQLEERNAQLRQELFKLEHLDKIAKLRELAAAINEG